MAQIPEFSQLSAAAQALVTQGYSFEMASLIALQTANPNLDYQAEPPRVRAVDHRMGRTPGPGQLPQFTALPAVAQQHVVDRGYSFAFAKTIEDVIAAAPDPVAERRRRQHED
jgi:hypothetical protein